MNETDLRSSLQRINAWFARQRPRYFAALKPGAAATELTGWPEPLRILLGWHDGQDRDFAGTFVEHWFLMSAADIRAARIDQPGWLPFLDDDAGNYLCLAVDGSLHYLEVDGKDRMVAASLAEWARAFADDLEQGGYVEDPERGDLLRKQRA